MLICCALMSAARPLDAQDTLSASQPSAALFRWTLIDDVVTRPVDFYIEQKTYAKPETLELKTSLLPDHRLEGFLVGGIGLGFLSGGVTYAACSQSEGGCDGKPWRAAIVGFAVGGIVGGAIGWSVPKR